MGIDFFSAVSAGSFGSNPGPERYKVKRGETSLAGKASGGGREDGFLSRDTVGENAKKASPNQSRENVEKLQKKTVGNHVSSFT